MHSNVAQTSSQEDFARQDSRRASAGAGSLKKLSDSDLFSRLKKYRGSERVVLVKILHCINEVERRRLYVPRGYATLYEFCTDTLKYSRSSAMRRIHAARCIERFPRIEALLLSGELTLSVVSLISRILTPENIDEILSSVRGKSSRDVEMLVSRHRPEQMLRDRVRAVCVMVPAGNENDSSQFPGAGKNSSQVVDNTQDKNRGSCGGVSGKLLEGDSSSAGACTDDTGNIERVVIEEKFKIEFFADPAFMEKKARVESLLPAQYQGNIGFEKFTGFLMDYFLDRNDPEKRQRRREERKKRQNQKRRESQKARAEKDTSPEQDVSERDTKSARGTGEPGGEKKRPGKGSAEATSHGGDRHGTRTRHIPREIRDEIYIRDGGRCAFTGQDGRRCTETKNLQIDHIVPYAKGGSHDPGNLRLLCFKHNQLAAEREFGRDHMEKFRRRE